MVDSGNTLIGKEYATYLFNGEVTIKFGRITGPG